jgi:glycolate oxidase iron-sulfur subunit
MTFTDVHISTVEKKKNGFVGVDIPSYDFITNCMRCGLCLPTCPTYALTGLEKSSPRGRIRLIKAVADGDLEITQGFVDEMNFCLDCQACETACPAGVRYGSLVESARAQIYQQQKVSWFERGLKWFFFEKVLSSKRNLKRVAKALRMYQRGGAEWILNKTGVMKILAPKMAKLQHLSPRINEKFFDESFPEVIRPVGNAEHRVAFLSGCIMNVAFADVNRDTIEVLLHNSCEVIVPRMQECCGSLQAHNGDFESARKLARHNIDVFLQHDFEAIVINSAGCGAFMKEYGHYLADDREYSEKAALLSRKVKDLTESRAVHSTSALPTTMHVIWHMHSELQPSRAQSSRQFPALTWSIYPKRVGAVAAPAYTTSFTMKIPCNY